MVKFAIQATNLGGAVHEAADVADVLLLELVHLLVLLVELLQLEGARALGARVVEVVHGESSPLPLSQPAVPVLLLERVDPGFGPECDCGQPGHVVTLQGKEEN